MKTLKLSMVIAVSLAIGVLATILFNRLNPTQSKNQICTSYAKDDIARITIAELMEDAARYRDTHAKPVEAAMRDLLLKNDTASRSCYYTLETLKKFLYYVEMYSRSHKIDPNDLAINFYYTVYPENKIMPDGKQYGSLHSLYLVPSKLDPEGSGYNDFNVITNQTLEELVSGDYKVAQSSVEPNVSRLNETKIFAIAPQSVSRSVSSAITSSVSGSPLMRNLGGLCPCPPKSTFAEIDANYPPPVGFK